MSTTEWLPRPVFVVGSARSGTSLLFGLLSSARALWSCYREEHGIFGWELGLRVDLADDSGCYLSAQHVTPERTGKVVRFFWNAVRNPELFGVSNFDYGATRSAASLASRLVKRLRQMPVRIVDKNPKHCFRIGFLKTMFPDAKFVLLVRDGRSNVASLMEGWERKGHLFRTHHLPIDRNGHTEFRRWAFDLPPNWRAWVDRPVPEVCAFQWVAYNESMLDAERRWLDGCSIRVRYEDLARDPVGEIERVCIFLEVPTDPLMRQKCVRPPIANYRDADPPSQDKWRARETAVEGVSPILRPMMQRLGYAATDG